MITAQDLRNFILTAAMVDVKHLDEYLETQAYRFNLKATINPNQEITNKAAKNESFFKIR
jgi:hypothetical protein